MTWVPEPDPGDWLQPWEELNVGDGWPEEHAGPAYCMAWWCMVSLDGDWYRPRARWVSARD